jgi:Ner family transcriptional regulator
MARPPTVWHREDIKAQLRKRFGTMRAFSRDLGYSNRAVSKALEDPRYSQRLEILIAAALDVAPHVLWPARWDAGGQPLLRGGDHSGTTTNSKKSCQKREAA